MGALTLNTDKLKASLTRHEGVRLMPYKDSVGVLTVGVGHNLTSGLPLPIVEALLDWDVAEAAKETERLLPWVVDLDDVRKRVFVELVFNMGSRILQFKVALQHSQAGRWTPAASAFLMSLWAKQVGQRAVTLTTMLETGLDPA